MSADVIPMLDVENGADLDVCPICASQLYPEHGHSEPDCAYIVTLQAAYCEALTSLEMVAVKEVLSEMFED